MRARMVPTIARAAAGANIRDRRPGSGMIDNRDFGSELALGSVTSAHLDPLSREQFPNSRPPKRLHMDENVRRIRVTRDESVALAAIEPFHRRFKGRSAGLGLRRIFRRVTLRCGGRAVIKLQQFYRLESFWPLYGLTKDRRTLLRQLESRLAHAGLMQQYVAEGPLCRLDEAIALH